MTEVTKRNYTVVTLHRYYPDGDTDKLNLFLTPGAIPEYHIKAYTRDGWSVFSVMPCNHEEYLNARVNDVVDSLKDTAKQMETLKSQHRHGEIDLDTYMEALTVCNEITLSDLSRLFKLMNRIWDNDYSVQNELAIQYYNMVF